MTSATAVTAARATARTRRGRAELTARESRAVAEGASMADICVCAVDSCSVKAPAVGRSAPQSAH